MNLETGRDVVVMGQKVRWDSREELNRGRDKGGGGVVILDAISFKYLSENRNGFFLNMKIW